MLKPLYRTHNLLQCLQLLILNTFEISRRRMNDSKERYLVADSYERRIAAGT